MQAQVGVNYPQTQQYPQQQQQQQQYPQQQGGAVMVQQTQQQGYAHSQAGTIAWGVCVLVAVLLYWISLFSLLGEFGTYSVIQLFMTSLVLPQILTTLPCIYSVYTWQRASVDMNYAPNSGAMIGGIVVCAITWGWLAVVAAYISTINAALNVICNDPAYTCLGTWKGTLDAFTAGCIGYLILATATMIIMSVDHVAYWGCCCNGTGRLGGGQGKNTTTTVVVQQQPMPMQTM